VQTAGKQSQHRSSASTAMAVPRGSGRQHHVRGRRAPAPYIGTCALENKSRPVHGKGARYGGACEPCTAATRLGGRRGRCGQPMGARRVARGEWGRKAVKAPSNATTLATWSPWDRRSQQGTGGCARWVGGAAGIATARDVACGRERLASAACSI
jgi:hypothetical protein